jgi:hypothetical protein
VKALPSSYSIDFADNLYQVLTKASNRLTELVRDFAKRKGLDPLVEVVVSLRRSTEADIKRRSEEYVLPPPSRVCGHYDPENKWIVLFYPCIANEPDHVVAALRTIAHELIHHCQFTCSNHLCKDMSEKRLTISDSRKISEMLPYGLEPYEIEAYMKQDSVADEIRKVIGSEVEAIIRGLDATLRPPLKEVANMLSKISDLYSHTYIIRIGDFNLIPPLTQFVENLLNRFVGREALTKKIATALSIVSDEDVRKRLERELNIDNLISLYTYRLSKECWKETAENRPVKVTSIVIVPVQAHDKSRAKVFIVTEAGFAISFTLDTDAPLAAIKLELRSKPLLSSLSQYLNSLKDTYLLHLANHDMSTDFIDFKHVDIGEQEVLKKIAEGMQCSKKKLSETIDKLICILAPILGGENIVAESLTIQGMNTKLIRIRNITKNSIADEVLLCSGIVGVGNRELDKERVVNYLLNPDSVDKEFVETFNNHINEFITSEIINRIIKMRI